MSGAAARTGDVKGKNVKKYIKRKYWEVARNSKTKGRRTSNECNVSSVDDGR